VRRGNGSRFGWCSFCSGSGLTLLSRLDPTRLLELSNLPFDACSGWLLGANDCLATKGFQLARLRHPAGPEIHVVNTHLDAGAGVDDRDARRRQLERLGDELSRRADGTPLIIAGDMNLDAGQPEDAALLETFKSALSLRDSGARAESGSGFLVLDYILFRGGPEWQLDVLEAGQDPTFFAEGQHLSDHPALFARFRISPSGE
jgi:endonuclease/exonuclease/phosphatase family metal-dependent hydrolase